MPQLRYRGKAVAALPGMLYQSVKSTDIVSRINDNPRQKQINEIAVGGALAETTYEIEIDSVPISVTTDAAPDADELAVALAAAINAEPLVSGILVAEADVAADKVTVTARNGGQGFTIVETQDVPGHLAITSTQTNDTADAVPFGHAVLEDGALGSRQAFLAAASSLTARQVEAAVTNSPDGRYSVMLEVNGEVVQATYDAATASVDDVVNGLAASFASDLVTATADAANDKVVFESETAGFADFRVTSVNAPGAAQLDASVAVAGDDIRELLSGVTITSATQEKLKDEREAKYRPNRPMSVLKKGGIWVGTEDQASKGDTVYVRLSANGSLDDLGGFRSSWNAGCVPLPVARWIDVDSMTLAAVELR